MLLHVVAWPAQSLSVYTFTNFEGVMISIKLFALGTPFNYLTLGWTCDLSCCFLHAVHGICSFLAHAQQFSHNCSVHCSSFALQLNERFCRWRPLHGATYFGHDLLWPRPPLATTYFGHDLFWPRFHRLWPRSIVGIFQGEEGVGEG